jgi:hypothetical protein
MRDTAGTGSGRIRIGRTGIDHELYHAGKNTGTQVHSGETQRAFGEQDQERSSAATTESSTVWPPLAIGLL